MSLVGVVIGLASVEKTPGIWGVIVQISNFKKIFSRWRAKGGRVKIKKGKG
jgi:hypothetical protein